MLRLKKHAINQAEDQMGFRTVARYTATQNTLISRSESGHTGGDYARAHGFAAARERYGPPPARRGSPRGIRAPQRPLAPSLPGGRGLG